MQYHETLVKMAHQHHHASVGAGQNDEAMKAVAARVAIAIDALDHDGPERARAVLDALVRVLPKPEARHIDAAKRAAL